MTEHILKDVKIYFDQYDLSGKHNELQYSYKADIKDKTAFGADSMAKSAGLKDLEIMHGGYVQTGDGDIDDILFDTFGISDKILTMCPLNGDHGSVAYFIKACSGEYAPGGMVGDVMSFNFGAYAQGDRDWET